MGLFSLIKLANDYGKAKKFVESKKGDVEKLKLFVEKIKAFINSLEGYKNQLISIIGEAKEFLKELEARIKKEDK